MKKENDLCVVVQAGEENNSSSKRNCYSVHKVLNIKCFVMHANIYNKFS